MKQIWTKMGKSNWKAKTWEKLGNMMSTMETKTRDVKENKLGEKNRQIEQEMHGKARETIRKNMGESEKHRNQTGKEHLKVLNQIRKTWEAIGNQNGRPQNYGELRNGK